MDFPKGVFEFTPEELDALFGDDSQATPPADETNASSATQTSDNDTSNDSQVDSVETTKAFSKRLNERTAKAIAAERETIAKTMGFNSYDEMIKSKETSVIKKHGLDPQASAEAVDEIVKMRLDADPRMKELEELRQLKVQEFGKQQLAEVTKLTDGEITSLSQLSKETIDLWKTGVSLKAAYLQTEGEQLLAKAKHSAATSSTDHLKQPGREGAAIPSDMRLLTDVEKEAWRIFHPTITIDELNKLTTKK